MLDKVAGLKRAALFPELNDETLRSIAALNAPVTVFGTVNNPVRMMMMEHDVAGEILRELRQITNDYAVPTDVCISYKSAPCTDPIQE